MSQLVTAPNFRDVGGGATGDGRVRRGLLFRSEAIIAPDAADERALTACGIRLVCDLRSDGERIEAPNRWWTAQGIELIECDILSRIPDDLAPWVALNGNTGRDGAVVAMERLYTGFPEAAAAYWPTIIGHIADGAGASLIHCTAGKDRTGFVCAVILSALGVPQEDVVRDYLASRDRRTDRARAATRTMIQHRVERIDDDALEAMMGVNEAYLAASLRAIEARHGGIPAYLADAGVDEALLGRLKARLLARMTP